MVSAFVVQSVLDGLNNPCATPVVFTTTRPAIEFLSNILGYADGDNSAVSNVVFGHDY